MKKIFIFIIGLILVFGFSVKNIWAGDACKKCNSYDQCVSDPFCQFDNCTSSAQCGSDPVPTVCKKTCAAYKYCSTSNTCVTHAKYTESCGLAHPCETSSCTTNASCAPTPTSCPGLICAVETSVPTTRPTSGPTAVPTVAPCEANDNNVCNNGSSYCVNLCSPNGTWARVKCSTNFTCSSLGIYCNDSNGYNIDLPLTDGPGHYYNINVGTVYCPAGGVLPTSYCHPLTCYSAPNSTYCPSFNPATNATCVANYGGVGNCDNCGGTDCGSCGAPTPAGPTPTGCPSCLNQPCTETICSDQTCLGTCHEYCYGKLSCIAPMVNSLTIKNASDVVVPAETGSRNHLCQSSFATNANPRQVVFEVNVSDENGWANISSATLRWHGHDYPMVKGVGSGVGGTMRVRVNFDAGDNAPDPYLIYVNVVDGIGRSSGFDSTLRQWKVWDCQVPVSGALYDGSLGQACDNVGFTQKIEAATGFSSLLFDSTTDVNMSVSQPADFGTNNLVWGSSYYQFINGGNLANPNGTLDATGRSTRLIDLGTGTTTCPPSTPLGIIESVVSAYSTAPRARIDYSFVSNQEGWYQVVGGEVKAKNEIGSGVPVTVLAANRALTLASLWADNGLVSFSNYYNINGNNDDSYGIPNNWWKDDDFVSTSRNDYQYFYDNFLIRGGVGTTGTLWSQKPASGVFFVNGDLEIDSNLTLAANSFLMVVVKGKISIDSAVSRIDGIYVSDGGMDALGDSDNQLVINGMLYSKYNIRLARSYTNKSLNNDAPAVVVNYRPDFIFNMPGALTKVLSGWREQ